MKDFVFGSFWLAFLGWFFIASNGCIETWTKQDLIKDKGFCVVAKSTGQTFQKCYEVKEK